MRKLLIALIACISFWSCSTSPNNNGGSTTTVIPLAPSNLTGVLVSSSQVDLTWIDHSTNETGFKIERRLDGGSFAVVGTVNADILNYSDSGLTTYTNYTYRVYSYNAVGNSITYSNEFSISTGGVPVLSTNTISTISSTTAVSGGNITDIGGSNITVRGVVWSTNSNPTIALLTKTSDGNGAGVFTSNVTGLTTNTTYFVRAYATNANGTAYGNEVVFRTLIGRYWQELGPGSSIFNFSDPGNPGKINNIIFDNNNNLFVSGNLFNQNQNGFVAKWNGNSWSQLGADFPAQPYAPFFDCMIYNNSNNTIIGAGASNAIGSEYVAIWNGINWSELGGANASTINYNINTITVDNSNNIYFPQPSIIKWNGTSFINLPSIPCVGTGSLSLTCSIVAMVSDGTNIYASGGIDNSMGKAYVAKWNGTSWSELGGLNLSNFNDNITKLAIDGNNNIYAGGYFKNANGKYFVAKWNGTSWSELGGTNNSTFTSPISALHIDSQGNVYINDTNNQSEFISKWDGIQWRAIDNGSFVFNGSINVINTDNNGNIFVGGLFTNSQNKLFIAKYGF